MLLHIDATHCRESVIAHVLLFATVPFLKVILSYLCPILLCHVEGVFYSAAKNRNNPNSFQFFLSWYHSFHLQFLSEWQLIFYLNSVQVWSNNWLASSIEIHLNTLICTLECVIIKYFRSANVDDDLTAKMFYDFKSAGSSCERLIVVFKNMRDGIDWKLSPGS